MPPPTSPPSSDCRRWRCSASSAHCTPRAKSPSAHLTALEAQLEGRARAYKVVDEVVEQALALLRPDGFDVEEVDGEKVFTATIRYRPDREHLLLPLAKAPNEEVAEALSFHYDPYFFDSKPEKDFLTRLLEALGEEPETVQDVLFTGGLTDRRKTDFFMEYEREDGRWHPYFPDFIIRRRDGRVLIVEVKRTKERDDAIDGENGRKALKMRELEALNPDRLRYEMVFTPSDSILDADLARAKVFVDEPEAELNSAAEA